MPGFLVTYNEFLTLTISYWTVNVPVVTLEKLAQLLWQIRKSAVIVPLFGAIVWLLENVIVKQYSPLPSDSTVAFVLPLRLKYQGALLNWPPTLSIYTTGVPVTPSALNVCLIVNVLSAVSLLAVTVTLALTVLPLPVRETFAFTFSFTGGTSVFTTVRVALPLPSLPWSDVATASNFTSPTVSAV